MSKEEKKERKKVLHGIVGGVFLIGLAILYYFDAFWPWILALLGIISIMESIIMYYNR